MKKLLYSFPLALLLFSACDYNAQFEGLDTNPIPTDVKSFDYTMSEADYAAVASNAANKALAGDALKNALEAVKSQNAFSLDITAAQYAPAFLAAKWPTADNGSAIQLTYNSYGELDPEVVGISAASVFTLSAADYKTVWGDESDNEFFSPSHPAAASIPSMLAAKYDDAIPGSYMMADYKQSNIDPVGSASTKVILDDDFNDYTSTVYDISRDGWYNVTTEGTLLWSGRTYGGNGYIQTSAYNAASGALTSYMITSPFKVVEGTTLSFFYAYRYFTSAGGRLHVVISENLAVSGDSATMVANVRNAAWVDVTDRFSIEDLEENTSANLAPAGTMSLDQFEGKTIVVAFKYVGDKDNGMTTTVQVDDVKITAEAVSGADPGAPKQEIVQVAELYLFDGSAWAPFSGAVTLQKSDFAEMGLSYDNFSSSANPDTYLPIWLGDKFKYAGEGSSKFVAYKYYANSATTVRADKYVFENGAWTKDMALDVRTDQFVKSNGAWTFDPSTVLNFPAIKNDPVIMSYYQAATDWVWENVDQADGCTQKGQGFVTSYGNNDYYSGSSAYYNNVDMRPAKAREQAEKAIEGSSIKSLIGMSDDEITDLMTQRLIESWGHVLEAKHPNVKPIEGIDVVFTVNLAVYTGTNVTNPTHTMQYRVVEEGKFEYIENSFKAL